MHGGVDRENEGTKGTVENDVDGAGATARESVDASARFTDGTGGDDAPAVEPGDA